MADECYHSRVSTQEIYQGQIRDMVLSSLQGVNGTIFMYGQTGSGKTYTMIGKSGTYSDGILGLSLESIFAEIQNATLMLYK